MIGSRGGILRRRAFFRLLLLLSTLLHEGKGTEPFADAAEGSRGGRGVVRRVGEWQTSTRGVEVCCWPGVA